jgi:hypothetical protein
MVLPSGIFKMNSTERHTPPLVALARFLFVGQWVGTKAADFLDFESKPRGLQLGLSNLQLELELVNGHALEVVVIPKVTE